MTILDAIRRKIAWGDRSFFLKLFWVTLAFAGIPVAALVAWDAVAGRNEDLARVSVSAERRAAATASAIDFYLMTQLWNLQDVASRGEVWWVLVGNPEPKDFEEATLSLDSMVGRYGWTGFFVADPAGNVLVQSGALPEGENYLPAPYLKAVASGASTLDGPRVDAYYGVSYLRFYVPVWSGDGKVAGVLVGRSGMEEVDRIVARDSNFGGLGEAGMLVGADGVVLSSPDRPGTRFRPLVPLDPRAREAMAAEARFGPNTWGLLGQPLYASETALGTIMSRGSTERARQVTLEGPDDAQMLASALLISQDWLYGVLTPVAAINQANLQHMRKNATVAIIAFIPVAILAFLSARWFTRPIGSIVATLVAITAGDTTRRVGLVQRDEVGMMSRAVDLMTDSLVQARKSLEARVDDLERSERISLTIAEVLARLTLSADIELAVRSALEIVVERNSVERATAVAWAEEGMIEKPIKVMFERGATAGDTAREVVVGDTPMAWVESVRRGTPVVIPDTEALLPPEEAEAAAHSGIRAVLAVPMIVRGQVIGFLEFSNTSGPKNWTSEDTYVALIVGGHMASVIENSSLRERTEKERATLESIIGSMTEGLLVQDSDGRLLYCNSYAERMLRVRSTNFMGGPMVQLFEAAAARIQEPPNWREVIFPALAGGTAPSIHASLRMEPGLDVELATFEIRRQGSRLGIGVVLRDVTQEREADRLKTEFVSLASHELRTPLAVVYGFAELLTMDKRNLSEQHKEWVGHIHKESERLTDIINDMLDVARIESGRLSVEPQPVSLGPLVSAQVEKLTRLYPSHRFVVQIAGDFPAIMADPARLTQVLNNLIDNAAKYSPKGAEVGISVRLDKGQAVIAVADHGVGIPESAKGRMFSRFFRVRMDGTESIRGTGLGLYMVKTLVELMGGSVWYESEVGKGSTFYFALPLA